MRCVAAIFLQLLLLPLVPASSQIRRNPQLRCGLRGYDRGISAYGYYKKKSLANKESCSAKCRADSRCKSFAYSSAKCLLYSTTIEENLELDSDSPYIFSDRSCILKTLTSSPVASSTVQVKDGSGTTSHICGLKGYDKNRPTASFSDDAPAYANAIGCLALCLTKSCSGFAFGAGGCLLYASPLKTNFDQDSSSPWTFYDASCPILKPSKPVLSASVPSGTQIQQSRSSSNLLTRTSTRVPSTSKRRSRASSPLEPGIASTVAKSASSPPASSKPVSTLLSVQSSNSISDATSSVLRKSLSMFLPPSSSSTAGRIFSNGKTLSSSFGSMTTASSTRAQTNPLTSLSTSRSSSIATPSVALSGTSSKQLLSSGFVSSSVTQRLASSSGSGLSGSSATARSSLPMEPSSIVSSSFSHAVSSLLSPSSRSSSTSSIAPAQPSLAQSSSSQSAPFISQLMSASSMFPTLNLASSSLLPDATVSSTESSFSSVLTSGSVSSPSLLQSSSRTTFPTPSLSTTLNTSGASTISAPAASVSVSTSTTPDKTILSSSAISLLSSSFSGGSFGFTSSSSLPSVDLPVSSTSTSSAIPSSSALMSPAISSSGYPSSPLPVRSASLSISSTPSSVFISGSSISSSSLVPSLTSSSNLISSSTTIPSFSGSTSIASPTISSSMATSSIVTSSSSSSIENSSPESSSTKSTSAAFFNSITVTSSVPSSLIDSSQPTVSSTAFSNLILSSSMALASLSAPSATSSSSVMSSNMISMSSIASRASSPSSLSTSSSAASSTAPSCPGHTGTPSAPLTSIGSTSAVYGFSPDGCYAYCKQNGCSSFKLTAAVPNGAPGLCTLYTQAFTTLGLLPGGTDVYYDPTCFGGLRCGVLADQLLPSVSGDTDNTGRYWTFEACRDLCLSKPGCLSFATADYSCKTNSYSLLGNVNPGAPDAVWTWWDIGCTPPPGSIYQGPNCGVAGNPVANPKYISSGPNYATTLDDCYFDCLRIPGCVSLIVEAGNCNTFTLPAFPDLVPATNGPWVYYDAVCFTVNPMRCGVSGILYDNSGAAVDYSGNYGNVWACAGLCTATSGCVSYGVTSQGYCWTSPHQVLGNVYNPSADAPTWYDIACPLSSMVPTPSTSSSTPLIAAPSSTSSEGNPTRTSTPTSILPSPPSSPPSVSTTTSTTNTPTPTPTLPAPPICAAQVFATQGIPYDHTYQTTVNACAAHCAAESCGSYLWQGPYCSLYSEPASFTVLGRGTSSPQGYVYDAACTGVSLPSPNYICGGTVYHGWNEPVYQSIQVTSPAQCLTYTRSVFAFSFAYVDLTSQGGGYWCYTFLYSAAGLGSTQGQYPSVTIYDAGCTT